jgi:hypothetical protein
VALWETQEAMAASEADATTAREEAAGIVSEQIVDVARYRVAIFDVT